MSPEKEYLSIEEVADLLGVTYQLIYKVIRTGELPASRVGKIYRVSRKDLEHYLEQSKSESIGATCSACGKNYVSQLSVKDSCTECGAPICTDCWTRLGVRVCREHGEEKKKAEG